MKGGKRAGAGRKKGSKNKVTRRRREIVQKALESGITPLDYMLDVMRKPIPPDAGPTAAALMVGQRFEAAKAAAPYVHPRLAAVEHTGKDGKDLITAVSIHVVGVEPGPRR